MNGVAAGKKGMDLGPSEGAKKVGYRSVWCMLDDLLYETDLKVVEWL